MAQLIIERARPKNSILRIWEPTGRFTFRYLVLNNKNIEVVRESREISRGGLKS
jgi:hypothetical protein